MTRRAWLTFLLIIAANFLIVRTFFPDAGKPVTVPYTLFKSEVTKGNVEKVYSRGENLTGRFEAAVTYPTTRDSATGVEPREVTTFATTLPSFVDEGLETLLIQNGVEISAEPIQEGGSSWFTLLFGFGPALLIIVFYVWMYRRASAQGEGSAARLRGDSARAPHDASTRMPKVA